MKPDDFEQQLQRQPRRQIPAEWRAGVLRAARAAAPGTPRRAGVTSTWWREWLWPSPWAWAGAAAVWALIFVLNFESSAGAPDAVFARSTPPPAAAIEMALAQRRQLLTSLFDPVPAEAAIFAPPRNPVRPQPRSEGRAEWFCA